MTVMTTPSAADILVELHHRGIQVSIRAEHFGLRPVGKTPDWLKVIMRQLRAELMALLTDPRRRWREQAEALIAERKHEECEDLLHLFAEREAIASVDGGMDDHKAGQLAYETLHNDLQDRK